MFFVQKFACFVFWISFLLDRLFKWGRDGTIAYCSNFCVTMYRSHFWSRTLQSKAFLCERNRTVMRFLAWDSWFLYERGLRFL